MKALMIINLHSGLKNSKSDVLDVIDVFCHYGYSVTTYVTQSKGDTFDYIHRNRISYDLIAVFGGDGTMNSVTNALMHKKNKPKLAYFPSGTMNDFGSNFNLNGSFRQLAERVCKGNVKEFDVGKFNDQYFNYVAAFGAMCDVPFTTDRKSKEVLGNIAYIIEGISKLQDVKQHDIIYHINGKEYQSQVLFGLIYSGNQVAGMKLAPSSKADIGDGKFNVLIVDYVPSIFEAPDLLTTLINAKEHIHRYRTDKVEIEFEDDLIWTVDGEEARVKDKVEISIINKALKLLT